MVPRFWAWGISAPPPVCFLLLGLEAVDERHPDADDAEDEQDEAQRPGEKDRDGATGVYHALGPVALIQKHKEWRGKIEVVPRAPITNMEELAVAYTPGVAEPCLLIAKDEELAYDYTRKGNLVLLGCRGFLLLGLEAVDERHPDADDAEDEQDGTRNWPMITPARATWWR